MNKKIFEKWKLFSIPKFERLSNTLRIQISGFFKNKFQKFNWTFKNQTNINLFFEFGKLLLRFKRQVFSYSKNNFRTLVKLLRILYIYILAHWPSG